MKIAVVMLGAKRGGIEQAAVDYCEALKLSGHEVTAFVQQEAAILPALQQLGVAIETVWAPKPWNVLSKFMLQKKLQHFSVVFVHGNRAGLFTTGRTLPPVIAIAHSRFFKHLPHFATIVALSQKRAGELGTPHVIPNLIRLPAHTPRSGFRTPPVIGTMGRLVPEKGFDLLLDALAMLRTGGLEFTVVIGGVGPLENELRDRAARLKLDHLISWRGWVHDKTAFFSDIDIFCMPSRTESFPITLLESMAHGLPIVVTDCGGPAAIIDSGRTGLLTGINATSIADALASLLANPDLALGIGHAARTEAEQVYALPVVATKLDALARLAAGR